jgi:hypothetical protein
MRTFIFGFGVGMPAVAMEAGDDPPPPLAANDNAPPGGVGDTGAGRLVIIECSSAENENW